MELLNMGIYCPQCGAIMPETERAVQVRCSNCGYKDTHCCN